MGDKTQEGRKKNFGKKNEKRLVGGVKGTKRGSKKDRITYVDKSTPV